VSDLGDRTRVTRCRRCMRYYPSGLACARCPRRDGFRYADADRTLNEVAKAISSAEKYVRAVEPIVAEVAKKHGLVATAERIRQVAAEIVAELIRPATVSDERVRQIEARAMHKCRAWFHNKGVRAAEDLLGPFDEAIHRPRRRVLRRLL
jgi:hypothetical protein